jgi:hypothetical protein
MFFGFMKPGDYSEALTKDSRGISTTGSDFLMSAIRSSGDRGGATKVLPFSVMTFAI